MGCGSTLWSGVSAFRGYRFCFGLDTQEGVLLVPQSDAPYFLQDLSFGASRSMMAMR